MSQSKICEYCGSTFQAERSTAKFCKPSHRSQYHQLPDEIQKATVNILMSLSKIETLLDLHPHLSDKATHSHKTIREYLDIVAIDI